MMRTGRIVCLMTLSLACSSKTSMNLANGRDAGQTGGNNGAMGGASGAGGVVDFPDLGPVDERGPPSQPDTKLALDDASTGGQGDVKVLPDDAVTEWKTDGKTPPDTSAWGQTDLKAKPDDSLTEWKTDAKLAPDLASDSANADAGPDLRPQVDVGVVVSGVAVIQYKDYGNADTTCVQSSASWIEALTTYFAEDRKCWVDSDCQYVSFSNSCGQVCVVPMNVQRIGEFATHAVGDFDPKCSTCPTPAEMPYCPPPPGDGGMVCKDSMCAWKS